VCSNDDDFISVSTRATDTSDNRRLCPTVIIVLNLKVWVVVGERVELIVDPLGSLNTSRTVEISSEIRRKRLYCLSKLVLIKLRN